jgi:hypothetical protein
VRASGWIVAANDPAPPVDAVALLISSDPRRSLRGSALQTDGH